MSILVPSSDAEDFLEAAKNHDPNQRNFLNWTDQQYYADNSMVTNSHLKKINEGGPLHLKAYFEKGSTDGPALIFGRAFHCLILEPDTFAGRFYSIDDTEKCKEIGGARPTSTNLYKSWKQEIIDQNSDKQILSMEDMDTLLEMQDRLMSIQNVQELLKGTQREAAYQRTLEGIKCKCKADALNFGNYGLDLKTDKDPIIPHRFSRTLKNRDYDQQTSFYRDILDVNSFWIVAIEKSYPYTIGIFEMSDDTYQEGQRKYRNALSEYQRHFINGKKELDKHFYQGLI